jgi:hypothetical protein
MTERHYIVSDRHSAWQYTYRGSITAPFNTREEAIKAAIDAAQESGDRDVEVIVQNTDMQVETVWRHGDKAEAQTKRRPSPA